VSRKIQILIINKINKKHMSFFEKMFGKNEKLETEPVDMVQIEKKVAQRFGPRLSELGPSGLKSLECFFMAFILLAVAAKGAENPDGKFINETPEQIALNKMVPLEQPRDLFKELYGDRQIIDMDLRYLNTQEDYDKLEVENKAGKVRSAITGGFGGHEIGGDKEN